MQSCSFYVLCNFVISHFYVLFQLQTELNAQSVCWCCAALCWRWNTTFLTAAVKAAGRWSMWRTCEVRLTAWSYLLNSVKGKKSSVCRGISNLFFRQSTMKRVNENTHCPSCLCATFCSNRPRRLRAAEGQDIMTSGLEWVDSPFSVSPHSFLLILPEPSEAQVSAGVSPLISPLKYSCGAPVQRLSTPTSPWCSSDPLSVSVRSTAARVSDRSKSFITEKYILLQNFRNKLV